MSLQSVLSSHSSSSSGSSFFFGERTSWSSRVRIHFMTNEIPQALARNNGLFGWLKAVVVERCVCVCVVAVGGSGDG